MTKGGHPDSANAGWGGHGCNHHQETQKLGKQTHQKRAQFHYLRVMAKINTIVNQNQHKCEKGLRDDGVRTTKNCD